MKTVLFKGICLRCERKSIIVKSLKDSLEDNRRFIEAYLSAIQCFELRRPPPGNLTDGLWRSQHGYTVKLKVLNGNRVELKATGHLSFSVSSRASDPTNVIAEVSVVIPGGGMELIENAVIPMSKSATYTSSFVTDVLAEIEKAR